MPRIKVDLWCQILGTRDRAVGHIRNLTVGGCRILSPSAFPVKETLGLVLAGPPDGPDLHLKVQLRWMALNPVEGPFELGCEFVHGQGTAEKIEKMLKTVVKRNPVSDVQQRTPSFVKFVGGLEASRVPGALTSGEVRKSVAADGLKNLLKPGPSAPLP